MWSLFSGWIDALGRPLMSAIRISQVVAFSRTLSVHLNPQIEGTEIVCPQFSGGRKDRFDCTQHPLLQGSGFLVWDHFIDKKTMQLFEKTKCPLDLSSGNKEERQTTSEFVSKYSEQGASRGGPRRALRKEPWRADLTLVRPGSDEGFHESYLAIWQQVTMPWHHRAMALHGQTWQSATELPRQGFAWSYLSTCQIATPWVRMTPPVWSSLAQSQWTDAHTCSLMLVGALLGPTAQARAIKIISLVLLSSFFFFFLDTLKLNVHFCNFSTAFVWVAPLYAFSVQVLDCNATSVTFTMARLVLPRHIVCRVLGSFV